MTILMSKDKGFACQMQAYISSEMGISANCEIWTKGKTYSSALFVSAFSLYAIAIPSFEEITNTDSGEFPATFTVPHMK
jgi:hypothetical protein